jgi:hypothetical protein
MSVPRGFCLLIACAPLLLGCTGYPGAASSGPPVDYVMDCQDKPYYDTLSASDHTTVIKGMTPHQREECMRLRAEHSSNRM